MIEDLDRALLESESEILKFLQSNSNFCRFAKEVTFVRETLQAIVYSVRIGTSPHESYIAKIPKKAQENLRMSVTSEVNQDGYHDLIFSSQMHQAMHALSDKK